MTKAEIQEKLLTLSKESSYPSLTITFTVNPENPQYEYQLKRHIEEAKQKLRATVGPEHSEEGDQGKMILERLEGIMADLTNFAAGCRGYGIFISPSIDTTICLPFEVDNTTTIGDSFQVRELAYALSRMEEYVVLHVSEHKVIAWRGQNENLAVVQIPDLPITIEEQGTYTDDNRFTHMSPAHRGTGPGHQNGFTHQGGGSQVDNPEHMRNFIVKIDQAVGKYLQDENLRVVLIGTENRLGHYTKYSRHGDRVIGAIKGNYDHLPSNEIGKMAAQVVQEKLDEEREEVLHNLQNAIGQKLYVAGVQSVWQAAYEGRVRTLVVEKHYQCKGVLKENGYFIEPNQESDTEPVVEDAVDDIIEMVVTKGGNVVFTEDGKLEEHQQLAAITRY